MSRCRWHDGQFVRSLAAKNPSGNGLPISERLRVLCYRGPVVVVLSLAFCFGIGPGCNKKPVSVSPAAQPKETARPPVRVLVVDDGPLADAVAREWTARNGSPLEISELASADLVRRGRLEADVIIYPSGLLGELAAAGQIVPLAREVQNHKQVDKSDIPTTLWQGELQWGGQVFALPLGSPQFCLFYRRDILTEFGIEPPQTWLEYQQAVDQIRQRRQAGSIMLTSVEPLASGWAGQLLLARAAAYVRHPNNYSALFRIGTTEPLIAGPPFVRALDELKAANDDDIESLSTLTPAKTLELFLSGEAIFAISWPQRVTLPSETPGLTPDKLGIAVLPGARQVFDVDQNRWTQRPAPGVAHVPLLGIAGRLGSITSEARQTKAAVDVLVMLTGHQWSGPIVSSSQSTAPFRSSHNTASWVSDSLSKSSGAISKINRQTQALPVWVNSPRLPGRSRYLKALDVAVLDVLIRNMPATESLGKAAQQWKVITAELGTDQQSKAYQQSLGLEP